ncbi:MAG: SRPBCC domain-containing protein [Gordonia sp. (in: high G+C Gram-positive bacteria)]
MPVTEIVTDTDLLTLTFHAEFAAPRDRVWAVYEDPRRLERVWGPPECPATFVDHDFAVGGRSTYFMTDPDGQKYYGWWLITAIDAPHSFAFDDGFADENFDNLPDLPVSSQVYTFTDVGNGTTRAVFTSTFASREAIQQVLDMGVVDGTRSAINQLDAVLAG